MRECGHCGFQWPTEDFIQAGDLARCSGCRREYQMAYGRAHYSEAESILNKEEQKRYHATRYQDNKERINRLNQKWKLRNPDSVRDMRLQRIHGISLTQYEEMLATQSSTCAICLKPESVKDPQKSKTKSLAVDHCHSTGTIRGLLCSRCNQGIGMFQDSPQLLDNAAAYLRKSRP